MGFPFRGLRARLLVLASFIALAAVLVVAAAHTPPARAWARAWVVRELAARTGISATAGDLSYNLLTLDVRASDLQLAAGENSPPFLRVGRARLDLPWRAVFGAPRIDAIELEDVQATLVRGDDGALNLPAARSNNDTGPSLNALPIGRLTLSRVSVRYDDPAGPTHAELLNASLAMSPHAEGGIRGSLNAERGPRVQTDAIEFESVVRGTLAYDGSSLTLDRLGFASPAATIDIDGEVGIFGAAPVLGLSVAGGLALPAVSSLLAVEPALTGDLSIAGTIEGPVSSPAGAFTATSRAIGWRHLSLERVNARVSASADRAAIERLTATIGGGTLEASGRVPSDTGHAVASVRATGVPLALLAGDTAPVAFASTLSAAVDIDADLNAGLPAMQVTADVRAVSTPGRPGALGLDGTLALRASDGAWRLRPDLSVARAVAIAGEVGGRFDDRTLAGAALGGRLHASASDAAALVRLARDLGWRTPDALRPASGRADLELSFGGIVSEPSASGVLSIADLRVGGVGPIGATARLAADAGQAAMSDVRIDVGRNTVTGGARLDRSGGTLRGRLDARVVDFGAFDPVATAWRPRGDVRAAVSLSGTQARPLAAVTVTGTGVSVAGQEPFALEAAASYAGDRVTVEEVEIRQRDGGRLTASGDYSPLNGRHTFAVAADAFRMTPVALGADTWPIDGVVSGGLASDGTLERPGGGGHFELADLVWDGVSIGSADADLRLADDGVTIQAIVPDFSFSANALVVPRPPYRFTIDAGATGTSVAAIVTGLGERAPAGLERLTGSITARVTAAGGLDDLDTLAGDGTLLRLDLRSGEAGLVLDAPATVRYAGSTLSVDRLRLRSGGATLDVAGAIAPSSVDGLTAAASGELADVRPWLPLAGVPADVTADGRVTAQITAAGSLDALRITGRAQLDDGRIAWRGYPEASDISTRLTLDGDALDVPTLRARWQGVDASGRARVPLRFLERWLPVPIAAGLTGADRTATARVQLDDLTPAVAAPFVEPAALDVLKGRARVVVEIDADEPALDRLNGSAIVTELAVSAVNVPIEQLQPTHLALSAGRLRVVGWTWNVAGSHLGVSGTAGVTGTRDLDARIDGQLDLRVLGLFVPAITASGIGDLAVAVGGTAAEPRAEGTIGLDHGELRLTDPQIGVTGAAGLITLGPNRVEISRFGGDVNGGRFTVHGGIDYRGLEITGGTLAVEADGVALNVPAGFRTEAGARLTAAFGSRIAVSGRVDVLRGAYRHPISLAAVVADAARRRQLAAAPAAGPGAGDRIDLDIAVTSADDLIVDNNYGRMDLGLDIRIVGTAAAPSVVGRASVREGGVLFLGGRTYLVERGVIDFTDPRTVVPELDLSARTRILGTDETNAPTEYDITLSVSGTPDAVDTALTSDPPRSQADIVSLLATGRLADQAGGAGTAVARDQVIGYLSGEALGFAARAVGLDSIRFEQGVDVDALQSDPSIAGEVNPAQRLTIARRLSRFVEVTVSQNLRDTGVFTWIVTYAPRRAVEIRSVSRDDRSRSYELRHDLSFGGPPTPRAARTAAPAARVTDIRWSGNPTVPTSELMRRLDLRVGDRFDFYQWQRDRDRLRRFFLDRGFLEARLTARQAALSAAEGGAGVRLEYDVQPGPRSTLVVDGYRLPEAALQRLRDIWSNAVVAVALSDDLRAAVIRELAEDGYFHPEVGIERATATDGSVTVRITIDPGTRVARRSVQVEGNRQLPAASIDAVVARHGLDAWLAPRTLADDLAEQYRLMGLLDARVTAGPIRLDDGSAILPVRIEEGEPFRIARVTIDGVRGRPLDAVAGDLGLVDGAPYLPDDVERGRRNVRRGYARDGYNAMTEETRTLVDRERGLVEVRVAVDEGPRQVVERVAVTGSDDVATRVVTDALDVRAGAPVDTDALYAGRRRLLQTGLFRRVEFTPVPLASAAPSVAADPAAVPRVEPVRLDVAVVRRTPWRLRYGVDVTDEDAPLAESGRVFGGGVNANLERFGLFGRPGTAGLSLRYNGDRRVARGIVTWPSLFGRAIASRLFLSRTRDSVQGENILAFVTDRSAVTAEQRFRPFGGAQVAYAYQFELNHVFDPNPDPDDPFTIDERWRQARLTASFILDTRSDPIEPRSGQLHSSNLEYGLEVLGRNGRFLKYSAQQFVFQEVLRRWMRGVISASGARVSLGRGFGQDLILSERFYAGGVNTVRGYPEDALGGLDFFGEPIPGQATIVLNQEVRFPLYRWMRGVGFVDAGDVFTRVDDLTLRSLKVGAGLGLRLATPVGLLRLDMATPLPRGDRPFKWILSFGHIF